MAWEKQVPHHKWKDELEAEAKAKSDLRKAKLEAKNEDHSKKCPFCGHSPVTKIEEILDTIKVGENAYHCIECLRLYQVKCPGTILLDGNPVIAEGSGQ